jgi:hypothetical protein
MQDRNRSKKLSLILTSDSVGDGIRGFEGILMCDTSYTRNLLLCIGT